MPGNTAALTQPGKNALYNPAPGQHDEALLAGRLTHHFRPQASNGGRLSDQRTLVAAVGPDQLQVRGAGFGLGQYGTRPHRAPHTGRLHLHGER